MWNRRDRVIEFTPIQEQHLLRPMPSNRGPDDQGHTLLQMGEVLRLDLLQDDKYNRLELSRTYANVEC